MTCLKVPLEPPTNSDHSNGAIGIAYIKLQTSTPNITKLSHQLTLVLGTKPANHELGSSRWTLHTPNSIARDEDPRANPYLLLTAEDGPAETSNAAIVEVAFKTRGARSIDLESDYSGGRFGATVMCPVGRSWGADGVATAE